MEDPPVFMYTEYRFSEGKRHSHLLDISIPTRNLVN